MPLQGLLTYTAVTVSPDAIVSVDDLLAAITPSTVMVTVMHSNNEVGSLQPIQAISAACKSRGIIVHSDAAQSIGKVPINVQDLGVDLLTVVGHKFGAPKGIGALFIRKGTSLCSMLHGGGQEFGRRAGTESVLLAAALGAAAAVAQREQQLLTRHMRTMRDRLLERLQRGLADAGFQSDLIKVNGPNDAGLRLPNTLSISVKGLKASVLLSSVQGQLAASAGAACHSQDASAAISPVLQAMKVQPEFAIGTLRLSTGRHTTSAEVDTAAELLVQAIAAQLSSSCAVM